VLTDYASREDGPTVFVPGSHRWGRAPAPHETNFWEWEGEDRLYEPVPIEAKAGSLAVWGGNTWHGAFEKKTDGLRLNVTTYHCHRRLQNQENYQWRVTQEMLDRNPPEFARLVAADDHMGWDENGPDYSRGLRHMSPEAKKRLQAMRSQRSDRKSASAA